ncbi:MAG: hypothetical protein ACTHMO_07190 [Rhodanobacteraceae bacterium]
MKVIVLVLLFAPMMALAGGSEPEPAIGPRQVCAVANTCASHRHPTFSSAHSSPSDSDAAGWNVGRPVAQFSKAHIAIWMPSPIHTQAHAPDANRGSIRAPLVLNLAATREDGESGTETGNEGFASRVHLLSKRNGGQWVGRGVAYTVSGREYIAIARWHHAPSLVLVFALP